MFPSVSRAETSSTGFAYSPIVPPGRQPSLRSGIVSSTLIKSTVSSFVYHPEISYLINQHFFFPLGILYKCRYLGASDDRLDCSICLNLPAEYECCCCVGQFSHRSECSAESCSDLSSTKWPPPRIDWMHPLSGPVEGGHVGNRWRQQSPHIVERDSWCVSSVMWSFDWRLSV